MITPGGWMAIGFLVILALPSLAFAQYVATNPKSWADKPLQGDGECVALVKAAANITATTHNWKPGDLVRDAKLAEGTAIATFVNGRYTGHAAIYLGQSPAGIEVVDQWGERKDKQGNVIRKAQPPHIRTIHWNSATLSDDGKSFRIID